MGVEPAGRGFSLGDLLRLYAACPQGRHRTQDAFDSFVIRPLAGDGRAVAVIRLPDGTYLGVNDEGAVELRAASLRQLAEAAADLPAWSLVAGALAGTEAPPPARLQPTAATAAIEVIEPVSLPSDPAGADVPAAGPELLTREDLAALLALWPNGQRRRGRGKDSFVVADEIDGHTRLIVSRRGDGTYSCVDLVNGSSERSDSLAGLHLRRPRWHR
ncbi:MAG: hypothetical protein U1E53_20650 [Dongiaceae bacterium]